MLQMRQRRRSRSVSAFVASLACVIVASASAHASDPPDFDYETPVFGLAAAPDGGLLVADAGLGVIELRKASGGVLAELPAVTDVAPLGRGAMWALTTQPDGWLYRLSRDGVPRPVADISRFEEDFDPDGMGVDTNPFDLAALAGGRVLVADAAANALLIADRMGNVDLVATFPQQIASTAHAKTLAGCPTPPEEWLEFVCDLPGAIPAEAVPTSVAVGPDGAYYVGELTGFPSPTGVSRIWRVAPGTRNAECGTDPRCTVVSSGFTSIIDLNFGSGGNLHVVELDENSWLELELGSFSGGTVNSCTWGPFSCVVEAGGLPIPTAVAETKKGRVYVAVWALVPGLADVIAI